MPGWDSDQKLPSGDSVWEDETKTGPGIRYPALPSHLTCLINTHKMDEESHTTRDCHSVGHLEVRSYFPHRHRHWFHHGCRSASAHGCPRDRPSPFLRSGRQGRSNSEKSDTYSFPENPSPRHLYLESCLLSWGLGWQPVPFFSRDLTWHKL